jgi:hypothetical protein
VSATKDFAPWSREHRAYADPDQFERADLPSDCVFSIAGGGDETDFLFREKPGTGSLTVVFNGAVSADARRHGRFPFFSGTGIAGPIRSSYLAVSDPTLHLAPALNIGWYTGSRQLDVMALTRRVVRRLADRTGARRILFLGGSAGGHASLNIALDFPGSIALVLNPQTNVADYYPGHTAAYARAAFGLGTYAEIPPAIVEERRLDLLPAYDAPLRHHVVHLQNRSDKHLRRHAMPLLRTVGAHHAPRPEGRLLALDSRLLFAAGDWGKGHVPPPRPLVRALAAILADHRTTPAEALRRCADHLNGPDAPISDAADLLAALRRDPAALPADGRAHRPTELAPPAPAG